MDLMDSNITVTITMGSKINYKIIQIIFNNNNNNLQQPLGTFYLKKYL